MEPRAMAKFALDPDASAVDFDEMLGDGEPQASAAGFAGTGHIDTIETLEDARLVGFGDANAGVGDGDDYFGVAGLGADDDFPPGHGVLRGVVQQILQHFGEPTAVSGDIGDRVSGLDGNVDLALGSARSEAHTSELQSQSNLVCRLLLEK